MCQHFENDDGQYVAWLDENPNGYVLNDFPGERILHRAACTHLRRDSDSGRRTVYAKVCCDSRDCILSTIRSSFGEAGHEWDRCRAPGTGCWT